MENLQASLENEDIYMLNHPKGKMNISCCTGYYSVHITCLE